MTHIFNVSNEVFDALKKDRRHLFVKDSTIYHNNKKMGHANHRREKMSKMITGSICLTDIIDKAKQGHSAFNKAHNGKVYCNILVWENDEPDKFNNNFSVQLNPKKDADESEKKQYVGNMKFIATNATPPQQDDLDVDLDNLPIGKSITDGQEAPDLSGESLPF